MNRFHFRTKVCLPCVAVKPCVVVLYLLLYQEAVKILSYLILYYLIANILRNLGQISICGNGLPMDENLIYATLCMGD